MNFAALALILPLATGNPPNWKMAPTPPCNCATGPAVPNMPLPGFPPFPQPCPPTSGPAPVLFTKIVVPGSTTVTAMPGTGSDRSFTGSTTFGFRPGYQYRLEIKNVPNRPNIALYPVIEVYGSLVPRKGLNYWEFPASITLTEDDLAKAASGAMVTKVIYLEDPKKALPIAATVDRPHEFFEDTISDAKKMAAENGRVVAMVTLGDRIPTPQELVQSHVNNTVLLPNESYLATPAAMPLINWAGVQLFDPIIGPKQPVEECITDGSDKDTRLGLDNNGKLVGLNPTDVAVEYSQKGKRKVATSNEVCICSPRFAIRKNVLLANGINSAEILGIHSQTEHSLGYKSNTHALDANQRVKANANIFAHRPMISANKIGLHSLTEMQKAVAVYILQGTHVVVSSQGVDEQNSNPDRLVVTKSVDPNAAVQIGDTVTFSIKYENRTNHPVQDLVITDSLSGRLELVPNSAVSDRTANVTTTTNEAGSVNIRFELPGTLQPGQTGVVKFRAKVR